MIDFLKNNSYLSLPLMMLGVPAFGIKLGVPASRVLIEDRGLTTREEAPLIKPMLAAGYVSGVHYRLRGWT